MSGSDAAECRDIMRDGDLVIIYESHDSLDHLYPSSEYGKLYNNRCVVRRARSFRSRVLSS